MGLQCPYVVAACDHGVCVANDTCACATNWTTTASSGGSCTTCVSGQYGPDCANVCQPCIHGSCRGGTTGDGQCVCFRGFWGSICSFECPGGAQSPCSDHGTCNMATGAVRLLREPDSRVLGWWPVSALRCGVPVSQLFRRLSNHWGCCMQRPRSMLRRLLLRVCPNDRRHDVICVRRWVPLDGGTVACTSKTAALRGSGELRANWLCPGASSDGSGACSSRGICDPDTGMCLCDFGWSGSDCTISCPGLYLPEAHTVYPCAGRGACLSDGSCKCRSGYFSVNCAEECPGGAATPCSGLGTCDPLTGKCSCVYGIYGAACNKECPGGRSNACYLHGRCNEDGTCACYANATHGFWSSESSCNFCALGYGGGNCSPPLQHGVLDSGTCHRVFLRIGPRRDNLLPCMSDPALATRSAVATGRAAKVLMVMASARARRTTTVPTAARSVPFQSVAAAGWCTQCATRWTAAVCAISRRTDSSRAQHVRTARRSTGGRSATCCVCAITTGAAAATRGTVSASRMTFGATGQGPRARNAPAGTSERTAGARTSS